MRTHGHTVNKKCSLTYNSWLAMRARCRDPNNNRYHRYGGRGIMICTAWDNFETFLADMGERPSKQHSIDRINNDGNYEPGNCRWSTVEEQAHNKTYGIHVTHEGKTLSLLDWEKELGWPRETIRQRIKNGMTPLEAISTPKRQYKKTGYVNQFKDKPIPYKDKILTATQWEQLLNLPRGTIYQRIRLGMSPAEAIDTPLREWGPNRPKK